jgi:aquaporin related protein
MLGGIIAAGIVSALFPGPLSIGVRLGGGTSTTQGLFIEMFLTAQLVIVIMFLAVEKHRATFLAPLGIGLSLFIAHLAGLFLVFQFMDLHLLTCLKGFISPVPELTQQGLLGQM